MHPDVCGFTSEVFYDGRAPGIDGLERQAVWSATTRAGAGSASWSVEHDGNTQRLARGGRAVVALVRLAERSSNVAETRRDVEGRSRPRTILVVTPYNAQIREIDEALRAAGMRRRVGTVDKFQGQEAPVVIYSMASSSAEDAPRGWSSCTTSTA